MPKYAIYTRWLGSSKYTCEAKSEEEAKKKFYKGDYDKNLEVREYGKGLLNGMFLDEEISTIIERKTDA